MAASRDPKRERFKKYLKPRIEQWLRETILAEMIRASEAANMPDGFIQEIKLERTSAPQATVNFRYQIVNRWQKEGKPLAKWFEYGTQIHLIEPKIYSDPLNNPTGPSMLHWYRDGKHNFRRIVLHPGIEKQTPMNIGYRIGKKKFRQLFNRRMSEYKRRHDYTAEGITIAAG